MHQIPLPVVEAVRLGRQQQLRLVARHEGLEAPAEQALRRERLGDGTLGAAFWALLVLLSPVRAALAALLLVPGDALDEVGFRSARRLADGRRTRGAVLEGERGQPGAALQPHVGGFHVRDDREAAVGQPRHVVHRPVGLRRLLGDEFGLVRRGRRAGVVVAGLLLVFVVGGHPERLSSPDYSAAQLEQRSATRAQRNSNSAAQLERSATRERAQNCVAQAAVRATIWARGASRPRNP